MKLLKLAMFFLGLAVFTGCQSSVLNNQKFTQVKPDVTGMNIVFERVYLNVSSSSGSNSSSNHIGKLVTGRVKAFEESVYIVMPDMLSKNNIPSTVTSIGPKEKTGVSKEDLQAGNAERHTLVITPTKVDLFCQQGCDIYVTAKVDLLNARDHKLLWTATLKQPMFDAPAFKIVDLYKRFSTEIADLLLKEINT